MDEYPISSNELAEVIIDRLFPMIDGQARAVRVQDTIEVIEEHCFDDNYTEEDESEGYTEDEGMFLDEPFFG